MINYLKMAVLVAAFGTGWHFATLRANTQAQALIVEAQEEAQAANQRASDAALELAQFEPVVKEKVKYVTKEVVRYEPANNCDLDDDFMRIYTAAVDVANTAGEAPAAPVQTDKAGSSE